MHGNQMEKKPGNMIHGNYVARPEFQDTHIVPDLRCFFDRDMREWI